MSYTIALTIHLFCAVIFIGFIFADIFILPAIKKVLQEEEYQKAMNAILFRARMIFPLSVLILILSGGFMLSKYMNSDIGFISTSLQQLLMLKVLFALLIVSGIIYSLSRKILKKQAHPIMKHFHKFVFIIGVCIIILAKFMFVL